MVVLNEQRIYLLIRQIIDRLGLDLRGAVVLTEAGSGPFIVTPFIASLAGASEVHAIVKDGPYGSREEILAKAERLLTTWQIPTTIQFPSQVTDTVIHSADIITNLGFVRPIDMSFIEKTKPGVVIPYMREAWEYRQEDVDLVACQRKNIPVMGTHENYGDLGIFDFCGPLAAKMLFEAGLEVKDSVVVVVGEDAFRDTIIPYLQKCGAAVSPAGRDFKDRIHLYPRIDAILVASFSMDTIIGIDGWLTPSAISASHPEASVVQLIGDVDVEALAENNVVSYPNMRSGPQKMAKTLADLGPKPVIDLHAAGLKVGELMWREWNICQDASLVIQNLSRRMDLCQPILPTSHPGRINA